MARKKPNQSQLKYIDPPPPIPKLVDVPGPNADVDTLRIHYRKVRAVLAVHRYDDVLLACKWCLDSETGLAFSRHGVTRGGARMFCSSRCAEARGAYEMKVMRRGRKASLALPESGETEEAETPLPPEPEANVQVSEITEIVGKEGRSQTTGWEPAGIRTRRARAKKPERDDGLCAKGLHEMDEANRYEYKNTVWCKACRKASRAKSDGGDK